MICGAAEIRASLGRQLLPALPYFRHGRPSSRLDDTWYPPIITEHFATIGSGSGGAPTDLAGARPTALAEQPPGELSAALGAAPRLGMLDRTPPLQWEHFLRRSARWGEGAGRRRRPGSWWSDLAPAGGSKGSLRGSGGLIHAICGRSEPAQHRRWHLEVIDTIGSSSIRLSE